MACREGQGLLLSWSPRDPQYVRINDLQSTLWLPDTTNMRKLKMVDFRSFLLLFACLLFYKGADGLRYHLEGFKCPSKSLPSVIVIEDDAVRIDKICEDLTVQIEDGGKEAGGYWIFMERMEEGDGRHWGG